MAAAGSFAVDSTAAELVPRRRPEPGAMLDRTGIVAPHERFQSRNYLNWRNYENLPPARTIIKDGCEVKEFEWVGLLWTPACVYPGGRERRPYYSRLYAGLLEPRAHSLARKALQAPRKYFSHVGYS